MEKAVGGQGLAKTVRSRYARTGILANCILYLDTKDEHDATSLSCRFVGNS